MGASPSTNNRNTSKSTNATSLHRNEVEVVKLMMPVYFNDDPVTQEEKEAAAMSWKAILENTAPEYLRQKKLDPNFPHQSSIVYFYNSFYARLFDIHPLAKDLFRDVKSQGKFLVKMISLALSADQDRKKFETTLIKLGEIHNERGVKAVECTHIYLCIYFSLL